MPSVSKHFPVILIGTTLAAGVALTLVSLFSDHISRDRETAVASAKYDGETLIRQLAEIPASSLEFREVDSGPLAPDLGNVREAWITWKESFASESDFPEVISAYRSRLVSTGWVFPEPDESSTCHFSRGEWTITLTRFSDPGSNSPTHFRRLIEWRTLVP